MSSQKERTKSAKRGTTPHAITRRRGSSEMKIKLRFCFVVRANWRNFVGDFCNYSNPS